MTKQLIQPDTQVSHGELVDRWEWRRSFEYNRPRAIGPQIWNLFRGSRILARISQFHETDRSSLYLTTVYDDSRPSEMPPAILHSKETFQELEKAKAWAEKFAAQGVQ